MRRPVTPQLVLAFGSFILAILNHPAFAQPPSEAARQSTDSSTAGKTIAGYPDFEIVESAPIETSLDHPDIRNAEEVWIEMIRGAERSIDFAEFYASDNPADSNDAIDRIVREIEAAAARGVKVRFLTSSSFYKTYPQIVDRLRGTIGDGAVATGCGVDAHGVLLIDYKMAAGGVLHAKYFIVDDVDIYLGSQNFDWRALSHIQEIGVRMGRDPWRKVINQTAVPGSSRALRGAGSPGPLNAVFNSDWDIARIQAGSDSCPPPHVAPLPPGHRRIAVISERGTVLKQGGDRLTTELVASPLNHLPSGIAWDEPRIVALIDSAKTSVSVQLLTYRPVSGGEYYEALEGALRRAAARGVQVRLLVADWCKRSSTIPYLKSLTLVPNVQVRMMTIPEWSGGFIPFARTIHAKYMVVDGRAAWIGTSNWEKDYFYESRNVGVIVESAKIGGILTRFFDGNWESEYAYAVDPAVEYVVPRIGE